MPGDPSFDPRCPLCDSGGVRPSHRFDGAGWTVWECPTCDDTFVWPAPPPERLGDWYRFDVYAERSYARPCRHNVRRVGELSRLLRSVHAAGAPDGRLLDVGSSVGHMLDAARAEGWRPEGIEIDPRTAEQAEQRTGAPVRVGAGLDVLGRDERFAVIVMSHWLEHTLDPGRELLLASEHLEPRGMLLLRVPNAESRVARLMRDHWTWFCPPIHLQYFSRSAIETAGRSRGLRVVWARVQQGDAQPLPLELLAGGIKAARSWWTRRGPSHGGPFGADARPPTASSLIPSLTSRFFDLVPRANPLSAFEDSELVVLLAAAS